MSETNDQSKKDPPKLIKGRGFKGYYLDDLKAWMDEDYYMQLQHWIAGQTVTMLNGRPLIYEHDLQKFLNFYLVRKDKKNE